MKEGIDEECNLEDEGLNEFIPMTTLANSSKNPSDHMQNIFNTKTNQLNKLFG